MSLTRRGLPSPSPLNNRNGLILLERWGVGEGKWHRAACRPAEKRKCATFILLGPAGFVVVSGGGCGGVGDRDSKLT